MDLYTASLLHGCELAAWHQADFKVVHRSLRGLLLEEGYEKCECCLQDARAGRSSCARNYSKLTRPGPPSNSSMMWKNG